jgi:hypothetical protein
MVQYRSSAGLQFGRLPHLQKLSKLYPPSPHVNTTHTTPR